MDEKGGAFFDEGDGRPLTQSFPIQNFSRKSMPRPRTFSEATEPLQRPEHHHRYPSEEPKSRRSFDAKSRTSSEASLNRHHFAGEDSDQTIVGKEKSGYRDGGASGRGSTMAGRQHRTPLQQTRDWWPEVLWCLLTIGLFVALVVILVHYNDKKLPEWPLGLTLNTAVAALATVARSVIIIPVAEGISQLKWNWFVKKERPIRDLFTFDQASRGPWGSFRMVIAARGRTFFMATLASLVLLSGLFTSFVTQSSISYSTRLVVTPRDDVVVRHARSYPPMTEDEKPIPISDGYVDDVMRTAFQAAFYPPTQDWPKLQPNCPSGECRWPLYESLSVCSITKNVTDQLSVSDGEEPLKTFYNATLLGGSAYLYEEFYGEMSSTPKIINMTSPEPESESVFDFPLVRESLIENEDGKNLTAATISQFFLIYTNNNADYHDKNARYRAAEILWYFCVNQYNTTVQEGKAHEEIVASTVKVSEVHKMEPPLSSKPQDRAAEDASGDEEDSYMLLESADGTQRYNVTATMDYTELDKAFRRAFSGDYSTRYGTGAAYTEINEELGKKIFYGVQSDLTAQEADDLTWKNLDKMVSNIAQATTNFIQDSDATSAGEALQTEAFVIVRWEWLAFLAAQVGLAIIFLVAIVINTARLGVDVVKSNNLAELFAAERHRGSAGAAEREAYNAEGLRAAPDPGVVARLTPENGVWGLTLQRKETNA